MMSGSAKETKLTMKLINKLALTGLEDEIDYLIHSELGDTVTRCVESICHMGFLWDSSFLSQSKNLQLG